ncbi:MAG: DUF5989 family protein [Sandaracinaceae bacterium]
MTDRRPRASWLASAAWWLVPFLLVLCAVAALLLLSGQGAEPFDYSGH